MHLVFETIDLQQKPGVDAVYAYVGFRKRKEKCKMIITKAQANMFLNKGTFNFLTQK